MENNANYTVAEGYRLPSEGKIYNVDVKPEVELRSMTARDEMKRLNPSASQFKTLANIIEGCLIEKPKVHVYDMALADYEYLLHKVRIVTYGNNYKISLVCPYCGETIETEIDLDGIQLKEFDFEKYEDYRNFTLPDSSQLITLAFSTPHKLDDIDTRTKDLKRRFPKAEIDFNTQALLEIMIESVDGEKLSRTATEAFINKLSAKDLMKILNNLDKVNQSFGLDNNIKIDCPHCGNLVESFFRFGTEFFRPTNI